MKASLQNLIVQVLMEGEATGYDVYTALRRKGLRVWPNNVYVALTKLEGSGLLTSRWEKMEGKRGLRRHYFSITEGGNASIGQMLSESLDLLMGAFIRASLARAHRPEDVRGVASLLNGIGADRRSMSGRRLVVAVPRYNPLVCFPTTFHHLSIVYPETAIYVVRPVGMEFLEGKGNITFLDGSREEMPVKDGFADCLILEGFPQAVSVAQTLVECLRVLRQGGNLGIMVSQVMTKEQRPQFVSFGEFVSSLYYRIHAQDRIVSIDQLKRLLSPNFAEIKDAVTHGNALVWATNKLAITNQPPKRR